jgi:hypothetical protein
VDVTWGTSTEEIEYWANANELYKAKVQEAAISLEKQFSHAIWASYSDIGPSITEEDRKHGVVSVHGNTPR